MNKSFICAFSALFGIFLFYACDNASTNPENPLNPAPAITSLEVSPRNVEFQSGEGVKDTTIAVSIRATAENLPDDLVPRFSLSLKRTGETLISGDMTRGEDGFTQAFDLLTSTTSNEEFIINVFAYDKRGNGNYAQSVIRVDGFSIYPPVILETSSPGEIIRPEEGEPAKPAVFTAKVTDQDGQNTIQGVFIRVIQNNQDVQGSPFLMADDGSTYRDEAAGDSVYTWSQDVTATDNNPDRDFDIEFFAVDIDNQYSDTVRTTFRIRGN